MLHGGVRRIGVGLSSNGREHGYYFIISGLGLEAQGNLASRLIMGIAGDIMWLMEVITPLTKSPRASK